MHEEQVALGSPGVIYFDAITAALASRQLVLDAALVQLKLGATTLAEVAARLVETLRSRHKVLIAGNGGSAAGAQHLAAELIGRFKREREAYAVLSLTTDTAILTAVANDYGYQDVFARQVSGLGQPGDLLIAFSTSGESENLARAATVARKQRMVTIAVTGDRPSRLERLADLTVRVPAVDTALVQELHLVVTHLLCDIVESELAAWKEAAGS
ncbi:D-sedoheptulose-7-phosphate isomerase [Nitrolancea hollandica]|uniref:Phosphoheptose isomerase n=1 Tax=Nitrolancea hollandica Lb TaxID=1129897 RepID=I4EI31_9BACT|nr:SIS domain-containing protein [Nitrolancea hollandica]CCF84343.1 Phosphoheptose isomerase [Nitrolancea hollandica Lb]